MLAKTCRWIFVLTVAVLAVLGMLTLPIQVSAAPGVDSTPNYCFSCHEDLYYLHDTGCWYCLTAHKDRCVDCHEGSPVIMKKEEAHLGLIAHPQENNGAKCLECHTAQVSQERLVKFESENGFDEIIMADAYTPSAGTVAGFPTLRDNPFLEKLPWLSGAFVLFGFWLILIHFSPIK